MYIGIDLGGTNIAAGLVDKNGKIVHKDSVKTNASRPYGEIIRDMAELSKKVAVDAGYAIDAVEWVGIGSPGTCDPDNGVLVYANNLPFSNTPMREEFQNYYKVPLYIENDANCAALGEAMAGSAKGTSSSVTITLGTGVGGGIIADGKILSSFNHAGGELGHMVISMAGETCTCGNQGCWEAYASATALIRQTREAMEDNPDSLMWKLTDLDGVSARTSFDAAKQGDLVAKRVVDRYLYYVSVGLLNVVVIFQPERIIVGGGVSHEGDYILEPIRKYVAEHDYCRAEQRTEIVTAQLGNDAGIIGAAFLGAQYQK